MFDAKGYSLDESDGIGQVLGRSHLSLGVVGLHADMSVLSLKCVEDDSHLNLDTQNTLTEEDVPDGVIDVIDVGLTRVNHESIDELHGFGTGGTKFTGNDNFATFGTGFHDESEDTVACTIYQRWILT